MNPRQAGGAFSEKTRTVRGKALIFWDPNKPGAKRDAIDTDQIMPADLAYIESLDNIAGRWKEVAFGHIMPDFRQRVHRGENFIVAGDRFAIGSSRESAVAGPKAIAEEAGLELVVVCGEGIGDIFRRNAINQGLHVCQSPEAVADAQDGDEFEFEVETRTLRNVTRGKTYVPIPLSPKEEELRQAGGIFQVGKAEFAELDHSNPKIEFPDTETARGMTTTEQIIWAHRVDKDAEVRPGQTLRLYADLLPGSDGSAPIAIYTFLQIAGEKEIVPWRCVLMNDHYAFTGKPQHEKQISISRAFAEKINLKPPYRTEKGSGIFHFYLPEQGLIVPGGFYPGADSHSRSYGAYGALGIGIGATALGFGWALKYVYFTCAKNRKLVFRGKLQPWVSGKDVVLALIRKLGEPQAEGMSIELVDADLQLPMSYRHTIANMMAEAEALNGIFCQDAITTAWYRKKGFSTPYPQLKPGENARYEKVEELNLSMISPMIAKPFHPSNAFAAEEVAKERITFKKAYIGSCTNGSYEDLFQAALVFQLARKSGIEKKAPDIDFIIYPGSGRIKEQIESPDPRLDGQSIGEIFRYVGGEIRNSWCGPCFGQGPDALKPGEVAITTFNRNFRNRMGKEGLGYLASPMVVASSVLCGYMAPPTELGISWNPMFADI